VDKSVWCELLIDLKSVLAFTSVSSGWIVSIINNRSLMNLSYLALPELED